MKCGLVFCNCSNFLFTSALEEGMLMFDVISNCNVFVQCPVLFVACDNPRASEFCHHMGSSAIYFCRVCEVRCNDVSL